MLENFDWSARDLLSKSVSGHVSCPHSTYQVRPHRELEAAHRRGWLFARVFSFGH